MRTYTIIAGINGVGKSNFTKVLKETDRKIGVIVDIDKITIEHSGNTPILSSNRV